jgi:Acetyltransferase (GNAT) family
MNDNPKALLYVRELSWEEISQVWETCLWPQRTTAIRPMSSMCFMGGFDLSIYDRFRPWFCGLFINSNLVGVISCHKSALTEMRLRGIWMDEQWRNRGLSDHLFAFVDETAIGEDCDYIWSFPRLSTWPVHAKAGYEMVSGPIENGDFGPNVYAVKRLK